MVVAAVTLYGCGGSGYLSEFPTGVEGDGCQPGQVVEFHGGTVFGGEVAAVEVSKGDITLDSFVDTGSIALECPGLTQSVTKVELLDQSGNGPTLEADGTPIGTVQIAPDAASCSDPNRCFVVTATQDGNAVAVDITGKAICDELPQAPAVLKMKVPMTATHSFVNDLAQKTVAVNSFRYKDLSALKAFSLEKLQLAYPAGQGDEAGELSFIEIPQFTEATYGVGIGFTAEEITAWKLYEKSIENANPNPDEYVHSVVMYNEQLPKAAGQGWGGDIIVPIEIEYDVSALATGLDVVVKNDQLEAYVQECASRDPVGDIEINRGCFMGDFVAY